MTKAQIGLRTNSKGQNVNFRISYKKRARAPAHACVAAVSDSFKPSGRRDAQEGTEEQNKSALNVSSPGNDCHAGELARRKPLVKPLRHRLGFFLHFTDRVAGAHNSHNKERATSM